MNKELKEQIVKRLTQIKKDFKKLQAEAVHDDLSDLDKTEIFSISTRIKAAIIDIAGKDSEYFRQIINIEKKNYPSRVVVFSMGVIDALLFNVKNEYLTEFSELIHANLFSNFLEMSEHLLDEGYKDAAAVITGSTLENHLKKLAQKYGVTLDYTDAKGKKRKRSSDQLNIDLSKSKIYSLNDQKQVIAWLGIRNSSAHGKYSEYTSNQVDLMIKGVRIFISSFKA